jgi:hypothetical protein
MTAPTRVAGLLGAALTTLAFAGPAQAAEPEKGEVSSTTPTIEWTGEAMGTAVQYAHYFAGSQLVDDCAAPLCDSFTLTVGEDGKRLVISAEDNGYTEMQIRDAAGNEVFYSTGEDAAATVFSKSNPKKGTVYTVEVLTDALAPEVDDASYFASATFTPNPPPAPPAEEEEPAEQP